jgi:hypothetical protein
MTYLVGDTVRLKSGGPVMCIEWLEEDKAGVVWMREGNKAYRDDFPTLLLEKVAPAQSSISVF